MLDMVIQDCSNNSTRGKIIHLIRSAHVPVLLSEGDVGDAGLDVGLPAISREWI